MSCTETRAQNMPTWEKHVELGPSDDKQVVDRARLGKHGTTNHDSFLSCCSEVREGKKEDVR